MEFVLNEYHRNVSDEELLEDMKRVAKQLNKETISRDDYKKHGKYSYSTFQKRFGGWNKAITLCGMTLNPLQLAAAQSTYQYGNISNEDLFSDILRVCSQLGKETISSGEYNKHGMYSTHTCFKRFGTWEETLSNAGIKPYVRISEKRIQDEELLEEIERLWVRLGRQPTTTDIKNGASQYTLNTYARHFGGWRGALEAFIDWVNQEKKEPEKSESPLPEEQTMNTERLEVVHSTTRDINLRLRFKVMSRDNFKCCFCGASPAKDPSVVLHIDHILPWVKGGETIFENLQTLCSECNLGKSDIQME